MKNIKKLFLAFILGIAILAPMQSNNVKAAEPQGPRLYSFNERISKYGIDQVRINELCPSPALFSWYDNGIPFKVFQYASSGKYYLPKPNIDDAGYGVLDSGLHFHKFFAKFDGRRVAFWACVDSSNDGCNNCYNKLLYDY